MTTTDEFTTDAREAAHERLRWHDMQFGDIMRPMVWMAEWARDHLARQEVTDAEVIAALGAANRTTLTGQRFDAPLAFYADNVVEAMRAALNAAYAARRDEEKRNG